MAFEDIYEGNASEYNTLKNVEIVPGSIYQRSPTDIKSLQIAAMNGDKDAATFLKERGFDVLTPLTRTAGLNTRLYRRLALSLKNEL